MAVSVKNLGHCYDIRIVYLFSCLRKFFLCSNEMDIAISYFVVQKILKKKVELRIKQNLCRDQRTKLFREMFIAYF